MRSYAARLSGPLAPGFAGERVRVRGSCQAEKSPLTLTLAPEAGARGPEGRPGLSLIEVLVALTIFLFAFVALGSLINISADRALEASLRSDGLSVARSALDEIAAGVRPLENVTGQASERDPLWTYSVEAAQETIANLWRVTVRASRPRRDGTTIEIALTQMVFDPTKRGGVGATATDSSATTTSSP